MLAWVQLARCPAAEPITASAVASIDAVGRITSINVINGGTGYHTEPTVRFQVVGFPFRGSGAAARAEVANGAVVRIVVTRPGTNYLQPPRVIVAPPEKPLVLKLDLSPADGIPKLTVAGPVGKPTRVDWAPDLIGPWMPWNNLVVGADETTQLKVMPGTNARYYRALPDSAAVGPIGFIWVPPGTFSMGSPPDEPDRDADEGRHTVTLTQGFWLSDHEVTQAEYKSVMAREPSHFVGSELPVEQVSWNDAVLYCQRLTELERAAGRIGPQQAYRLPTEAEWEYAARAETEGARHGQLDTIAWYAINAGAKTHVVRGMQPNAWGLYDMIGNVFEWCADWKGDYPAGAVTDPLGPDSGVFRMFRGGGWYRDAGDARSAERNWLLPELRLNFIGFRPALNSFVGPSIVFQPQAITVAAGQSATFRISASGTPPLNYQWQRNGTNMPGATSPMLTIHRVMPTDVGDYKVMVSNAAGSVASVGAKLEVFSAAGFVWIPPGRFIMGSPDDEPDRSMVESRRTVTLSEGFWLSNHEVTQAEYAAVMGGNPSYFIGAELPVEQVSWSDAVSYCQRLTELGRAVGRITTQQAYRLPTEAEWEYAARAGTTEGRYGELGAIAWHSGTSESKTHTVMGKEPNEWGLHDMIGNVWEWCGDWYGDYEGEVVTDPVGPSLGSNRVIRGGGWLDGASDSRAARRGKLMPVGRGADLGFRPALAPVR